MSKPKIKSSSMQLSTFLKIKSIKMPIFQRKYSWGESSKKNKALDYFKFLTSTETIDFLGNFFCYSKEPIDIGGDLSNTFKNNELFLADGQHRLITIVLAAHAINKLYPKSSNSEEIKSILNLDIEVIINSTEIKKLDLDVIENKRVNSAIQLSYTEIFNFLTSFQKEDPEGFIELFVGFKQILKKNLSLNILMPSDETEERSDINIEDAAFSIFNQLNGQSVPLQPEELFVSILNSKYKNSKVLKCLDDTNGEQTSFYMASKKFKIDDSKKILDFFIKIDDYEGSNFNWVNKFYIEENIIKLENNVDKINTLYKILNSENKNKFLSIGLFDWFSKKLLKMPIFVYLVKNIDNFNIMYEEEKLRLFKLFVLIEIMVTYKGTKTANIARDFKKFSGTDSDIFKYIAEHFGIKEIQDKKEYVKNLAFTIYNHLINFQFGEPKYIDLGKLFLIINIVARNQKKFVVSSLVNVNEYEYEHVWAKKYNPNDDTKTPLEILEKFKKENIFENEKILNSIGNGILLTKHQNTSYGNMSPYSKWDFLKNDNRHEIQYWSGYENDILDNGGIWLENSIKDRTKLIVSNVLNWIFIDWINEELDFIDNELFIKYLDVPFKKSDKKTNTERVKKPDTTIEVYLNDKIFQECDSNQDAITSLVKVLEYMNPEKIYEEHLEKKIFTRKNLIIYENKNEPKGSNKIVDLSFKKHLYHNVSTQDKINLLRKLENIFNLGFRFENVPFTGSRKTTKK